MPVTWSLCHSLGSLGLLLLKVGSALALLAVSLGMLITFPYLTLGRQLLRGFPGQAAASDWLSAVMWGTYSVTDILAQWPAYHPAIVEGIQMSWMGIGFLGLLMVSGLPLGILVMALLACRCPTPQHGQR